jgi:hypothetical protein
MITLLTLLSCTHIVIHCIFCITKMKHETYTMIWAYHALLSTGALLMGLNIILNNHTPSIGASLIIYSISIRYVFDRRICHKPITN